MKFVAIVGAILLVASAQINAQPTDQPTRESFYNDVVNITDSMLSSEKDPNNVITLAYKISAVFQALRLHDVDYEIYHNTFRTLGQLEYMITSMKPVLRTITRYQNQLDGSLDQLSIERDVDEVNLPSEINTLIDEFFKRATETIIPIFKSMYAKGEESYAEVDKLCANLIPQVDSLAKSIDTCLQVAPTEFGDIFQCHEEVRSLLPGVAHDTALITFNYNNMRDIEFVEFNESGSLVKQHAKLLFEARDLMHRIDQLKVQREQERDEKITVAPEEPVY